ncbi:MAG: ATP-dependent Lhr-like helicase [Verrucomicrobiales bacterium]|jgi:ATP-dependent Lhr-like helicase
MSPLQKQLHPDVADWLQSNLGEPTQAQEQTVPHILNGESVLLSSPTGTGKTLAGFLGVIDRLYREHLDKKLRAGRIRALYVSPLRALTYDIRKNLAEPLEGLGVADKIRIASRTGDTTQSERAKTKRSPPHIFLTTPESLAIILCQKSYREALSFCETVIIDELHALVPNKRGTHLMLSLERLEELVAKPLCRVGLSATVAPLGTVAAYLSGVGRSCRIVEPDFERKSLVEVMTPLRKTAYPPAGWTGARVTRDVARIVEKMRTTIIFTNTRSGAENTSSRLKNVLPHLAHLIETHHSSLDRDVRLEVEDRLKAGELRAVVCSTSLELGIDIGSIDTVIMMSTPKGISRALQRIGRSGHSIHKMSHGVLVATNINDLIECVVCAEMVKQKKLDPVTPLEWGYDVIIQHIVGMAMAGGVSRENAFKTITRAWPFRNLTQPELDRLIRYLEGGGESLEGQYRETFGKIVEVDGVFITPTRKIERDYLVNVGVIASEGMIAVMLGRKRLGFVEEGFARGLKPGDHFVLAGRVVRFEDGGVGEINVTRADGRQPSVPTWNANKMPLASGLANEVTTFRTELHGRMVAKHKTQQLLDWLVETWNISTLNAEAVLEHFRAQKKLSDIPRAEFLLIEKFRDPEDPDRLHCFFHCLIGRAANDAISRIVSWRLKKHVGGNAMVTIDDYGFLLSLKSFQDLDLDDWRELFLPADAEKDLRESLQESQLVKGQFRGVAQTGLMVPRNLPGQQRQLRQLRWSAEILFRVLTEHEPDHPLIEQAIRESTHTYLDIVQASAFLAKAQSFDWRLLDVPVVTPFSFGMFVSKIKEGMMMEDPDEAIERLFYEMSQHLNEAH